jgi:hypothetical protein
VNYPQPCAKFGNSCCPDAQKRTPRHSNNRLKLQRNSFSCTAAPSALWHNLSLLLDEAANVNTFHFVHTFFLNSSISARSLDFIDPGAHGGFCLRRCLLLTQRCHLITTGDAHDAAITEHAAEGEDGVAHSPGHIHLRCSMPYHRGVYDGRWSNG